MPLCPILNGHSWQKGQHTTDSPVDYEISLNASFSVREGRVALKRKRPKVDIEREGRNARLEEIAGS